MLSTGPREGRSEVAELLERCERPGLRVNLRFSAGTTPPPPRPGVNFLAGRIGGTRVRHRFSRRVTPAASLDAAFAAPRGVAPPIQTLYCGMQY